jgi:hypothetical protein
MKALIKVPLTGMLALLIVTAWGGNSMAQSIYVDYYTPQFYMDNLVFYDDTGAPIYYENNVAYAVPGDYPGYNELVNNFANNEDAYFQWFEEVGYNNLQFRRTPVVDYYKPIYYDDYPVFFVGDHPVYYVDGIRHAILSSDRRYARLMRHYRKHRSEYNRWYRSIGRSYRWYRRSARTDYYAPQYYEGYLVFYDASGIPYYYRNGRVVHIPRTYRRYNAYISHYRNHRNDYDRWYKKKGHRRHGYRRPRAYLKRVVAPKAPRAHHGRAENRRYRPAARPHIRPVVQPNLHKPPVRVEPDRHGHRDVPDRPHHVTPPPRQHRPRAEPDRHGHRDVPDRPHHVTPPPRKPRPRVEPKRPMIHNTPSRPSRATPMPRKDRPVHVTKPKPPTPHARDKHKKEKEKKKEKSHGHR